MIMPGDMSSAPPDSPIHIDSYNASEAQCIAFKNGKAPDIIHAWTPRSHVVRLIHNITTNSPCRYVVHMEDNEETIVGRELPSTVSLGDLKTWPADLVEHLLGNCARTNVSVENGFIANADGYSCLTDRLLEFSPEEAPSCVISPGFDPIFERRQVRAAVREALGIAHDQLVVTYCGNVHSSNLDDMRSLYAGLALVGRQRGEAVLLLRSGWDQVPFEIGDTKGLIVRSFGFVGRELLPSLVHAADILVQPGRVDAFNAYRFPSKVPDYLVSGRPLILPDTNIGLRLIDDEQAIKLKVGDAFDIATCIGRLADNETLRGQIGAAGRAFAQQELTWATAAHGLEQLYEDVLSRPARLSRAKKPRANFPVPLIALVPSDFVLDRGLASRLEAIGVQAVLSPAMLETIGDSKLVEGPEMRADALVFDSRWSEQIEGGLDYMVAAAREISALVHPETKHPFVGAPDQRLSMASVSAYAQWLRLAVRHAFRMPGQRYVFIAGLSSILEKALSGDSRSEATLAATRSALVSGISIGVRPQTVQDEAEFLATTVYRSDEK